MCLLNDVIDSLTHTHTVDEGHLRDDRDRDDDPRHVGFKAAAADTTKEEYEKNGDERPGGIQTPLSFEIHLADALIAYHACEVVGVSAYVCNKVKPITTNGS